MSVLHPFANVRIPIETSGRFVPCRLAPEDELDQRRGLCSVTLLQGEAPRLCQGGSKSLTNPGVHP